MCRRTEIARISRELPFHVKRQLICCRNSKENKRNIWICGGASIVNQVLQAHMADEITVSVMPVLLGDGIRLFDKKEFDEKLKLISTRCCNGIVDLTYQMRTE